MHAEAIVESDLAPLTDLPEPLIDDGAHGDRLVEAPLAGHHREAEATVRISIQQLVRQARGLPAEDQRIAELELGIPNAPRRPGREQP